MASRGQQSKPTHKVAFWLRLLIGLAAILCLIATGVTWMLSTGKVIADVWSTILLIAFAVLGVIFAFCQWFFPFTPLSFETTQSIFPSTPTTPSVPDKPSPQGSLPTPFWNVPFRRNPFFTGRENLLQQLHDNLTTSKTAALTQAQAISGLGGIGKTQTAIEYAYRYREMYQAVLWVRAATKETLISDFVLLAGVLHLPEKDEQDQNIVVTAVMRWMATHEQWLLILDNADDLHLDFVQLGGKNQA